MTSQAYKILKSTAYAKEIPDVLQDALIRLIRHYDKLKTMENAQLAYYVTLTVKSAAIDYLRKADKGKNLFYDIALDELPDQETPEQHYIRNETIKSKTDAIRELPEAHRDLILYKYVLEKPNAELAELYGTSEANIRQMLCRIRRNLMRRLKETS